MSDLRELWQYRELLFILVQRDLKIRYKNSILGFGWSLINPLVQVVIITIVLGFLAGGRAENYHAYVFCALLPWLFFSTALLDSTNSLLLYRDMLRRIYFPREIAPLATVIGNFIHFLLAAVVFLAYMAGVALFWWARTGSLDWPIQWTVILTPIPVLGLVLLASGLAMFLSVWTLYFEDIRFLVDSGIKILYWAVPILYFTDLILHKRPDLYHLYMLNPLAALISSFRRMTLPPTNIPLGPDVPPLRTSPMDPQEWGYLGLALLVSLGIAWLGHRYFSSRKWGLAERV